MGTNPSSLLLALAGLLGLCHVFACFVAKDLGRAYVLCLGTPSGIPLSRTDSLTFWLLLGFPHPLSPGLLSLKSRTFYLSVSSYMA